MEAVNQLSTTSRDFVLNTTVSEQKEIIEGICALGGAIYICKATDEEKAKMKSFLQIIDKVAQKNWKQILDQAKLVDANTERCLHKTTK